MVARHLAAGAGLLVLVTLSAACSGDGDADLRLDDRVDMAAVRTTPDATPPACALSIMSL